MRARPVLQTALFALLALATFVAGAAGPLHEFESLRGHEHCVRNDGRDTIGHVCHDEDACTVCSLLALPCISDAGSPPDTTSEPVVEPVAARPESVVAASAISVAPARAPPVL